MTVLPSRVSGVTLLERSLVQRRPGYEEYVRRIERVRAAAAARLTDCLPLTPGRHAPARTGSAAKSMSAGVWAADICVRIRPFCAAPGRRS